MYNGHFGRPLKSIYARTKMASATHNNTLLCFLITRSTIIRRPRDLRGGIPARTYYTYVYYETYDAYSDVAKTQK